MEQKKHDKETRQTLAGIHALYISGKITLEQHNSMCYQVCNGSKNVIV